MIYNQVSYKRCSGIALEGTTLTKKTRLIVHIDENLCNGCGDCVPSCAEGAIQIIDGKARLLADNLCDGLGACLGHCPMDAIRLEERPADEFDHAAVEDHLTTLGRGENAQQAHRGPACPGMREMTRTPRAQCPSLVAAPTGTGLVNWPIQLGLVNPQASYFTNADLLLAADCTAFADPRLYQELQAGRVTLIGCPKLDDAEGYVRKLARILEAHDVRSITVAMMEVPCCSGMARIVQLAQQQAGTQVPVRTEIVGIER
jgi:ferredoxin